MNNTVGFSYDAPESQDTISRWQAELDRIRAGTADISHLRLVWQPGDPWDPCGRWWIYDCIPAATMRRNIDIKRRAGRPECEIWDHLIVAQLDGPDPRTRNYFDRVKGQFVRDEDCLIDLTQWRLWRALHVYAVPFWVIQGHGGGHPWRYKDYEARALRLKNLPDTAPKPGSLPYAPFDRRVIDRVMRYDRLQRAQASLEKQLGRAADRAAANEAIKKLRAEYLELLEDLYRDALPLGMNGAADGCLEAEEERFINHDLEG